MTAEPNITGFPPSEMTNHCLWDTRLQRYRRDTPGEPEAALLCSCVGRGEQLYGRPDHDSHAFLRAVGGLPLGGFFCNGEIGPVGGRPFLHAYTSAFGMFRRVVDPRSA